MSASPSHSDAVPAFELGPWTAVQLARIEEALERWVAPDERVPPSLAAPMRYAVLDGGKRLRPLLVLAACEAVGGQPQAALRAACAVELIHAYSLVHDDMPCMDNDVLRRGKPTVHVRFGEAAALLAGDALQALAFELLTPDDGSIPLPMQARLCRTLAQAAGASGMAGGQAIDLASARGLGGGQHQQRAQALAAIKHRITHGLTQRGRGLGIHPARQRLLHTRQMGLHPGLKIETAAHAASQGLSWPPSSTLIWSSTACRRSLQKAISAAPRW